MSKHGEQIAEAANGKIAEELLGAAFAKPRGSNVADVGGYGVTKAIGDKWAGGNKQGAETAGIVLANPGAIAVTPTSLVSMAIKVGFSGKIKEVTEVLSTVPLADVESLEVKRVGMAGVMEINAGGSSFKLEGKVNDLREVVDAFDRARGAAV